MNVLLLAHERQKDELLSIPPGETVQLSWISTPEDIPNNMPIDVCVDLQFENSDERVNWLNSLKSPLVVVNSVVETASEIQHPIVRINGWNTFLKRPVMEAACADHFPKEGANEFFSRFGRRIEWVPDIPGFITPRVIACIINEAFFALQEEVSTREDIDIAMKLGTAYPLGPFEWGDRIGLKNISALLERLGQKQARYKPAPLLRQAALA